MRLSPPNARIPAGPLRVSLPRFIMLAASVALLVGLGALAASAVTGRGECAEIFFRGSGALFLAALALFQFCLARMVLRQFSEGEPLQPAWFLIMVAAGCRLVSTVCIHWHIPGTHPPDVQRYGMLVGGPLEMALMAGGLACVLRVCRRTRIAIRWRAADSLFLLAGAAAACFTMRLPAEASAYNLLLAGRGPLLLVLLLEATLIRRYMAAVGAGLIAKCWSSFTAAIFLAALGSLPLAGVGWCISLLSATAFALGPAWQLEAVQSACGEVGVSRFSPFAMSLSALRLLNTSR